MFKRIANVTVFWYACKGSEKLGQNRKQTKTGRGGYKNIKNTLIYTQLIEFEAQDRYHFKVAKTLKDTCNLLEAGYECVTETSNAKIFRKRG